MPLLPSHLKAAWEPPEAGITNGAARELGASMATHEREAPLKRVLLYALVLLAGIGGLAAEQGKDKLSRYFYEDTRQLVAVVEEAADLVAQKGEAAFEQFRVANSKWLKGQRYLFIYDAKGKCVFHPIEPRLIGQELIELKDLDGRPMVAMITDVAKRPEPDASDWVFYLWEESWKSRVPEWKSSYIRKAVAPGGGVYLVGSGSYNIKPEKSFLEERVNRAAALIKEKGTEAAFAELRNRACPLHILNTYITVTDSRGDIVVDPSFPTLVKKRNLSNFCDATGRNISSEVAEGLKNKDQLWVLYLAPKGEAGRLARHLMCVRKVRVGDEVFFVSVTFVPATPVWMKQ